MGTVNSSKTLYVMICEVHNSNKPRISQLRALATHTPMLGSVAQGALELCLTQIRKCHF